MAFAQGMGAPLRIWAPRATNVEVVVGDRRIAAQRTIDGVWQGPTLRDGDRYKVSLDGGAPMPDPRSRYQPDGVHGASQWVELGTPPRVAMRQAPLSEAVIYELPQGFCTKPCMLPDSTTSNVPNDPQCDPAGGVDCIGNQLVFQYCAVPCTDDNQCNRDGYMCRRMPMISSEGDPTYCLMPDCCDDLSCAD